MLSTKNPLYIQTQIKSKWIERDVPRKINQKKVEVAILVSDGEDFKENYQG